MASVNAGCGKKVGSHPHYHCIDLVEIVPTKCGVTYRSHNEFEQPNQTKFCRECQKLMDEAKA